MKFPRFSSCRDQQPKKEKKEAMGAVTGTPTKVSGSNNSANKDVSEKQWKLHE